MDALNLIADVGRGSIELLWIPLLAWTAVAIPAYLVVRFADSVPALVRYWTAISVLFALPIGLLGAALVAIDTPAVSEAVAVISLPQIQYSAPSTTRTLQWSIYHTAGFAFVMALVIAMVSGIRLISAYRTVRHTLGGEDGVAPEWIRQEAETLAGRLGIRRRPRIALRASAPAPLTFGFRSPVIILPERLLDERRDLRLALLHELIHVQRQDYLLQWIEHALGALFIVHPLVTMMRRELSILREVTCDADVLAHAGERGRYARLLYRYAALPENGWPTAVGILQEQNHLQKRIVAMKSIFDLSGLSRSRRTAIAVSVVLLGAAVTIVACSDIFVDSPAGTAQTAQAAAGNNDETFVVVEQMPELIGGLASIQGRLTYPEKAKDAGVEGRVIVQFIVDEQGDVIDPVVVRGVGHGLDEAALAAVSKARFKPGRQRGEAVRVKMSLPVTFRLGGDATQQESGAQSDRSHRLEEDVRTSVDRMPELDGGFASVAADLKYPELAKKAGIEGTVIVEFIVDEQGSVMNPQVVRGVGSGLDEEALRAVQNASFIPGEHEGKPVRVKMALPITFKLP